MIIGCPTCNQTFNVKDEYAGKKGRCSSCKTSIQVPYIRSVPKTENRPDSNENNHSRINRVNGNKQKIRRNVNPVLYSDNSSFANGYSSEIQGEKSETRSNARRDTEDIPEKQSGKRSGFLKFISFCLLGMLIGAGIFYAYPKLDQLYQSYSQIAQLTGEKERMGTENERLIQANKALKQENERISSELGTLSHEKEQISNEKEQVSNALAKLERENGSLSSQVSAEQKKVNDLNWENRTLSNQLSAKQKEVTRLANSKDNLAQNATVAITGLISLDDKIISKYWVALNGIIVAFTTKNYEEMMIATEAAVRAIVEIEQLERERNRILGR